MKRLLLILALAALVGCQPPKGLRSQTQTRPDGRLQIAVVPKGTTHEFWRSVHYGALQAAEEFDVEVLWLGPQHEGDREAQISIVQNFVTKDVDGICLAPIDSQALVSAVREAGQAGIPTVIWDSGLADANAYVSYVATDNYRGGELAAETMAEQLGGKGKVILLRYSPGSESTEQREQGFLDKLRDYPEVEVISSDQYAGTTAEQSLDKAQQLINRFRGEFDGIFAVCESNAAGTLGALENAELAGKVVFIGFDPNPRMVQALSEGKMHGIVLQDPVQMGYLAVKTMAEHLRGKTDIEKRVSTGEYVATRENMNSEQMQRLLQPPQAE